MNQKIKRMHRAICELDEKTIRAIAPNQPASREVFWRAVHKARCELQMATPQQKAESRRWLAEHGSAPLTGWGAHN